VEGSILAAERAALSEQNGGVGSRIASAWRRIGLLGRVLAIAAVAASGVVAATWASLTPFALATGLSLALLAVAAMVDAVERRIPNALVGAAVVPVAVAATAPLVAGSTQLAVGAIAGAALLGGPLLLTHLVAPAGMGFGDVKAGAVLGAALGLVNTQIAVLALLLSLATSATWALAHRQRTMPLGPGLIVGALAALTIGRLISLEVNSW
jgi:leader peptidase (prepilin peptidase) / N-methyltransferase